MNPLQTNKIRSLWNGYSLKATMLFNLVETIQTNGFMKFVKLFCLLRDNAADIAIRLNPLSNFPFPKNPLCVNSTQESKLSMNRQKVLPSTPTLLLWLLLIECFHVYVRYYYCYFVHLFLQKKKKRAVFHFSLTFHYSPFIEAEAAMKIVLGCHSCVPFEANLCQFSCFIISLFWPNWFSDQFSTWNQFYSE